MRYFFRIYLLSSAFIFSILCVTSGSIYAQWNPTPNDTLTSFIIHPDSQVTFKVYAPNAGKVLLEGTDIPNLQMTGTEMTRSENGIWKVTIGPVPPGSYRYNFNVDGVFVLDPRNPLTSQSNMNSWSLIHINGSDFMDTKDVPHGAISEITYFSESLQRFRRMHIYTPPGYNSGKDKYPVFYLLHGAFDSDDSWSTVGRAGFILDNLIAEKKAVPMLVIMPAGHTGPFRFGQTRSDRDEFVEDFKNDIVPYVESHYHLKKGSKNTAIAGLSMGGGQALNIIISDMKKYGYIGVFSSGIFGITGAGMFGQNTGPSWGEQHKESLDNADIKKGIKLFWFATGNEDFLIETSRATVEMFKSHGFDITYKESSGGHTWINWRDYLHEFSQLLFK